MLFLLAEESAPNPSTGSGWPAITWQQCRDGIVNLTPEHWVMMALMLLAGILYIRGRLLERTVLRLATERNRKDEQQTTTPSSPSSGLTFYQIEALLDKVLAAMQATHGNALAMIKEVYQARSQSAPVVPEEDIHGDPHQAA